jgi:hypothetical protein
MFLITMLMINIFTGWLWGDWRNWEKYQSTFFYVIVCDLIYNFLTYNYSLWEHIPVVFFPNHTVINLMVMFIAYPPNGYIGAPFTSV